MSSTALILAPLQGILEPGFKEIAKTLLDCLSLAEWQPDSDDELQMATDVMNDVRKIAKQLETDRQNATRPKLDEVETIRIRYRPFEEAAARARALMDAKIKTYVNARAERLAAAEMALTAAAVAGDEPAAAIAVAALVPAQKTTGLSLVPIWRWKEINHSIVPTSLTVTSDSLVGAEVKRQLAAGAAAPAIPGMQIYQEQSVRGIGR